MNELNKNSIQFDYFSNNYRKFEEDFYRFSNINIPLTFLTDDILYNMVSTNHEYFRLNGKNSKDGKDHYFVFKRTPQRDNTNISQFEYLGHCYPSQFMRLKVANS